MIQGFDRAIPPPVDSRGPVIAGSVRALLLAAMTPALVDAILTAVEVKRHLGFYADAIAAGMLVATSVGVLLGSIAFAVTRILTRHPAGQRLVASICFGAASAVVVLLAIPRVIGFDQPAVQAGFMILPVVTFGVTAFLRFISSPKEARLVLPSLAPAFGYAVWVLTADPGLAATRNARILSLAWLPVFVFAFWAVAAVLERRVPVRREKRRIMTAALLVVIVALAASWLHLREPLFTDLRGKARGGPPDVLLIVLDTARSDLFSIGDPEIPLPVLRAFAAESRVYSSAFASSCWTLPTHGAMFTGLPPSLNGTLTGPLTDSVSTVAQRFRRSGYRTAAFSGNPVIGPSSRLDRGFELFENFLPGEKLRDRTHVWLNAVIVSRGAATKPLWHLRDDGGAIMVSRTLRFLDETEEPAFIFLNLFEPHDPYEPPFLADEWATRNGFSPRELRTTRGEPYAELSAWPPAGGEKRYFEAMRLLYKGELAYVDRLLGELFQRLEAADRMEDMVIVIASDHGENIGEHFPSLTHTLGLFDTLIHVPFMVRYPAKILPGESDVLISTDHVHDMLLGLAGVEGVRVIPENAPEDVVFSEYVPDPGLIRMIEGMAGRELPEYRRSLRGVRTRHRKWIEASDGRHQAFDLRIDPLEQRNLVRSPGTVPPGFEDLAARLAGRPQLSREGNRVPEELEKSLRALGYNQ